MGFYDFVNFVVYDNPVSKTVTSMVFVSALCILTPCSMNDCITLQRSKTSLPPVPNVTVITEKIPLWKLASEGGPFIRIAALLGASAVALGAYGAHRTFPKDREVELKLIYNTANQYHFFHSLALLGVPLCQNPKIAGILILSGTILFSGTLYYHALTTENKFGKLAPLGGTLLILGWLSMVI
ncbi:transmembrane protein 256 homolog isoform X1 [Euwallacea fornicatus]|uniref:transmembrane protein 256 homolog isoform X1 n=1 Tax=Euwallacea fornicatus TaxID=995702 RepID=UPI00338F9874